MEGHRLTSLLIVITHLEPIHFYHRSAQPPPTPDPYSPPTTPQLPCKFHNPNVKRFQVHTSLSHLSTLQLSVTRLAPIGPVTFAPSALVHSLRLLVQSISLTQMPPHWNSLASSGRHLRSSSWGDQPVCTTKASKQTRHEMVSLTKAARQELLKLWPVVQSQACTWHVPHTYIPGREMSIDEAMVKYKGSVLQAIYA